MIQSPGGWCPKRKHGLLKAGPSLALALVLVPCAVSASGAPPSQAAKSFDSSATSSYALIPVNKRITAPDFTVNDIDGDRFSLSQYRDKVVLLDFWAVDCGGCRVEVPWYVEFSAKYRRQGLALIGLDMYGEKTSAVKAFMKKMHMRYRVAIGSDAIGNRYHVDEMPLTLLIDRRGRVALSHAGIVDKVLFEKDIQALLQK